MELNKKKADLNKDGKLSGYEKKRGMAIQTSMKKQSNKPTTPKRTALRKPKEKKYIITSPTTIDLRKTLS